MNILVLDFETTMACSTSSASSPYCKGNRIVAIGYSKGHLGTGATNFIFSKPECIYIKDEVDTVTLIQITNFLHLVDQAHLLVGHNIGGFDLNWLRKLSTNLWNNEGIKSNFVKRLGDSLQIWDTQLAQYLLSGQYLISPSLDELCVLYNLPLKDSKIREYWSEGIDTDQIPPIELIEYLAHDVEVTSKIFLKQYESIASSKAGYPSPDRIFKFISTQMLARLATAEMEWNGMYFNTGLANKYRDELTAGLDILQLDIIRRAEVIYRLAGNKEDFAFNPSSPRDLKLLLYGGILQVEKVIEVEDENGKPIIYKSGIKRGQKKTKKVKVDMAILPALPPNITTELHDKSFSLDTSEETLKALIKLMHGKIIIAIVHEILTLVNDILQYRSIAKEISTYLIGYTSEVHTDFCIHTSYNHTVTRTGRLSSSKPNLQNISSKSYDPLPSIT